jgi:hypothetical protein
MARSYDYFIAGDHEAGRRTIGQALEGAGYRVTVTPEGNFVAETGSLKATIWLGAIAGKNLHRRFEVQFFTNADGSLVARLVRDIGRAAIKGGAIGATVTSNSFADLAKVIGDALTGSQQLSGSLAND